METAAPQPKPRILVVDDEPAIAIYLCEVLSKDGFTCVGCGGAEAALAELAVQPYELMISDVNMPGRSGLELLAQVRRDYPDVVVLIATAANEARLAVEAMKGGAADYLTKPLKGRQVVEAARGALEQRNRDQASKRARLQLEELAGQQLRELEKARHEASVALRQTLRSLGRALEIRARDVAGHSERVSLYSVELARGLGYLPQQLERLRDAAYIHDIGKLQIPEGILFKPAPLAPAERAIMRTHVEIGHQMVLGVEILAPFAELILAHHESFDGSGYPRGLAGSDIPLDARVFAVADTLDAMTSDRPYRGALPWEEASREIRRQAGIQFDPEVVAAFERVPIARWQELRTCSLINPPEAVAVR